MSNSQPRFPPVFLSRPLRPPVDVLGPHPTKAPNSPLSSNDTFDNILRNTVFCNQSINMIQSMRDLTILAAIPPYACVPTSIISYLDLEFTLNDKPYIPFPRNPTIFRIVRLASIIYERALLTPPTPLSSVVNHSLAEELARLMVSPVHDVTWTRFPGLLLWILLVGSSSIRPGRPEHCFFVSWAIKIALVVGYGWWEETSKALALFLRIKVRAQSL